MCTYIFVYNDVSISIMCMVIDSTAAEPSAPGTAAAHEGEILRWTYTQSVEHVREQQHVRTRCEQGCCGGHVSH